jgi:hypothetical protein
MKPFEQYLRLTFDLFDARRAGDEAKENEVLDALDAPWYKLTEEELELVDKVIAAIRR